MLLVGVDWAERHHDICVLDDYGAVLAKRRIPDGLGGVAELHALLAGHAEDPSQVVVGIETDGGLLVGALLAAGYRVYAVNPLAVSRYRDRHAVSGAKSDRGDAKVLADLVRTDRHNHRQVAGDSPLALAVKLLARAQQQLVWTRQDQVNALRSALRGFYPAALEAFGTDLASRDALAVLAVAHSGGRPPAAPGRDHLCAAAGGPPAPGAGPRGRDPGGAACPAVGRAGGGCRCLRPGRRRHRGDPARAQRAARRVGGGACGGAGPPPAGQRAAQPAGPRRGAGRGYWASSATTRTTTRRPRAARRMRVPRRSPAPPARGRS
jgi:hypothetical protein